MAWIGEAAAMPDQDRREAARERQARLTKPAGSLGRLEEVVETLAALQTEPLPGVHPAHIAVFAADHGVVAEGVSAFPQAVTAQMVRNFAGGGAAISVIARELGATLEVINVGTVQPLEAIPGVTDARLAPGTANFTHGPAMQAVTLAAALQVGRRAAAGARERGARLFIGGEMGIGNTTAAAALACALLELPASRLAGPGTGLDHAGVQRKCQVIERALALHAPHLDSPLQALRRVGGLEIAALTGAFLRCAQQGMPVLVDGFIAGVAALTACRLLPGARDWLLFAHESAEPGHLAVLQALGARPLLNLGMRLGEGSGAGVALPLLALACALHAGMATFAEAGVCGGSGQ